MNKSAIQNYAVWARNELIARVSQKAYEYARFTISSCYIAICSHFSAVQIYCFRGDIKRAVAHLVIYAV